MKHSFLLGDCRELLKAFPPEHFHACVTDPPYDLTGRSRKGSPRKNDKKTPFGRHRIGERGFMGQTWDGTAVAFDPATWDQVFRVLKPGAHGIAFGATRTYHRMACAVEDAGFEVVDSIHWIQGQGMPKGVDVSKAIDKLRGMSHLREVLSTYTAGGNAGTSTKDKGGTFVVGAKNSEPITLTRERGADEVSQEWDDWRTALKPAHEPILVFRKPLKGTVAKNVLEHRTGAMNIGATRVATTWQEADRPASWGRSANSAKPDAHKIAAPPGQGMQLHPGGRWPPNVVFCHSPECLERCVPWCPVADLEDQSGVTRSGAMKHEVGGYASDGPANFVEGRSGPSNQYGDKGTATRFFPVFRYEGKVTTAEREEGCDVPVDEETGRHNNHPTVKPIAFMRWLVRLVTPRGGVLLEPFLGSGTTALAAALEEVGELVGMDTTPRYIEIAESRLANLAVP